MKPKKVVHRTGKKSVFAVMLMAAVFVFLPTGTSNAESANDILVIANNSVPVSKASLQEIRTMFLKQRQSWRGGGKVFPLNAKPGTNLRKAFQERVLGMNATSEQAFWQEQRIKKGLSAPSAFSNTLKAVFSVKGSVGYCYRKDYKAGLAKVLLVL